VGDPENWLISAVNKTDFTNRNDGEVNACKSGGYRMKAIAEHYGLHYSSVSKNIQFSDNS
jgi:hypothetical protein